MLSKENLRMVSAEFLGTSLLSSVVLVVSNLFGLGTAAWYTALSAGVALSLIVSVFGAASGAHVNPAVTIGLWTLQKIPTTNAVIYVLSQLLGGASALLFYNFASSDTLTSSALASFDWRVFWVEMIGAAIFGMGIASAVAQKLEGYVAAFTIGVSLTVGALIASTGAPGFLNPAVALGNNAWGAVVVVAPVVGMVVGMNLYMYLIAPEKVVKKIKR